MSLINEIKAWVNRPEKQILRTFDEDVLSAVKEVDEQNLLKRTDSISADLIFTGYATDQKAGTDEAKWLIKRQSLQGGEVVVEWASNDFDKIWDDRIDLFPYENPFSVIFNGIDEYLDVSDDASIDFVENTQFSISLWIKTTSSASMTLFHNGTGGQSANDAISIYLPTNGKPTISIRATGTGDRIRVRTNDSINDGNWHLLTFTSAGALAGASTLIYLNGALAGVVIQDDTLVNSITGGIGWKIAASGNTGQIFDGNLDEIAFWNKVLSLSEVEEIYNSGMADNLLVHSATANLVAFLNFNDKANFPITKDRSVNSNDATLVNMSTTSYDMDTP